MKPNKQLLLKKRPVGLPEKDTWELVEVDLPQPNEGEFMSFYNQYLNGIK